MAHKIERTWRSNGLMCVCLQNLNVGHRCGYVGVPRSHPLYENEHSYIDGIDVHGGLSYSGGGPEYPIPNPNDLWWFGFDCCHVGDRPDPALLGPERARREAELCADKYGTVKTEEYVVAECEKLAKQLADYPYPHKVEELEGVGE